LKSLGPVVALLVSVPALAQSSVPPQLAYEGRLAGLDGTASTGTPSITFSICASPDGGTTDHLWDEMQSVTLANGLYSVTLGKSKPLPPMVFDGNVLYLEITINGTDTLAPRQPIGSVPYSILSGGVQGGPVNATSYALNGSAFANDAGRTLISLTTNGVTSSTSVAGLYCGASGLQDGAISDPGSQTTGYRASKIICQNTCGSPTAHMCSGSELRRTLELEGSLPASVASQQFLWYSSDVYAAVGSQAQSDCRGWTDPTGSYLGTAWSLATPAPNDGNCNEMLPIACCD